MSSVVNDPGGRKRILFMAADGNRRAVRLGAIDRKAAAEAQGHIDHLVEAASTHRAWPDATRAWVDALPAVWRKRLLAAGLVAAVVPEPAGPTLQAFLDGYIQGRGDVKASTVLIWKQTCRNLVDFFGADKPLADISDGDADRWREYLTVQKGKTEAKMAAGTVGRRCGLAKQFFRRAMRLKLIPSNPFADLVAAVRGNPKREYFIKPAVAQKVLDAAPDGQWRLLFALARWGGLRTPSEPLGMMWQDVDWAGGRMMIRSPKTAHHPGGESRIVPLFPELLPYLREVFEQAEPGAERVFPKWQYRGAGTNLRTGLLRILAKAGVKPWPKLFQNLRATRETELAATWPMHVVCEWIGNSLAVANEHYLQVTEADYLKAAQKAAQYGAEPALLVQKSEPADVQKTPDLPNDSELYTNIHMELVGATGLEPVTSWV